ncbi:aminodeoxychorismate lyase [Alkalimonas mucilaginosa]|uniref:Aminodeoxychorismate lyase n=1 Tax=Alkalimonas mucilaginosa TaxID=3057676 RepID=A0ABU7JK30_9GAMM|nr:aminodeoxychorismate lyase [Alkalimonas sp. MEB004]MEE2025698.1 aminodeoxychorismate lyase [Alkalimonas sp. MEB004]
MDFLVQAGITTGDRSFQFGDGIFTTIRVRAGVAEYWPLHLTRLQQGVTRLGFREPDWQQLSNQVQQAISAREQVIKVVISRGHAGRGYSPAAVSGPDIYISTAGLPDYQRQQQLGIGLGLARLQLGCQPLLAGIKHNNRLEQVLLKQELAGTCFDDLLVLDQRGFVTEAIAANVFFYRDGRWFTPLLDQAGVAGVMRQVLQQQLQAELVQWPLDKLQGIEALFCCNALCGVLPVHTFAEKPLQLAPVRQVQQELACYVV